MLPFPFVVGRGRSGTTLVRSFLDSHPDVAIPDETHFILPLAAKRRLYERADGFSVETFLRELRAQQGFKALDLTPEEARSALESSPPSTCADAIRALFSQYARQRAKPRYGDKTPIHVLNLGPLAELFGEARFVHIIRDGRDVALSYLDVSWGAATVEEAAVLWRRAVRAGRRSGQRLGPTRYLEIRYERLIDETEDVVASLCAFLELEFDARMLRYPERAHEVAGRMGAPETRRNLYLPPTRGLRDWRSQMAPDELARFEVLAGDLLEELGYERGARRPGSRAWAGATRRRLAIEAARAVRKAGKLTTGVRGLTTARGAGSQPRRNEPADGSG